MLSKKGSVVCCTLYVNVCDGQVGCGVSNLGVHYQNDYTYQKDFIYILKWHRVEPTKIGHNFRT